MREKGDAWGGQPERYQVHRPFGPYKEGDIIDVVSYVTAWKSEGVRELATGERYSNSDIADNATFLGWLKFEIISFDQLFKVRKWYCAGVFEHREATFSSAEMALAWINEHGGALSDKGKTGNAYEK